MNRDSRGIYHGLEAFFGLVESYRDAFERPEIGEEVRDATSCRLTCTSRSGHDA